MEAYVKWEYATLKTTLSGWQDEFSQYGLRGWELVAVDNGRAFFKRRLRSKSEAEILKHFDERIYSEDVTDTLKGTLKNVRDRNRSSLT